MKIFDAAHILVSHTTIASIIINPPLPQQRDSQSNQHRAWCDMIHGSTEIFLSFYAAIFVTRNDQCDEMARKQISQR
jgi:hypothetical protein